MMSLIYFVKDCYWANLCITMEALFEIDLGPACQRQSWINLYHWRTITKTMMEINQIFLYSFTGRVSKKLIEREIVSFVEKYCR